MANLRIINDNAVRRATVLTANSEASASTPASNLRTSIKGDVYRSVDTAPTLTLNWTTGETIGGVFLAFCNLTNAATVRVRGYTNAADDIGSPLFDSGAVVAAPGAILGLWDFAAPLGVNAFAYGGGTYGRVWISVPGVVKKLLIDISDATNPAGYVEIASLVCGNYWSPTINADYGAPLSHVDNSKLYRNDAGDLLTDRSTVFRKQSISLSAMSAADRAKFWEIIRGNGKTWPLILSLYPLDTDPLLEQAHQLFCKVVSTPAMSTPSYARYASSIEFEEV